MSTHPSLDNVLLLPLLKQINQAYGKKEAETLKLFAKQYFASTANTELAKYTEDELFVSMADAWRFMQQRSSTLPKIEFVYRKLDKDAKRQTGTSVYMLLDDMPFLVDSVRQSLNRAGVIIRSINNAVFHVERVSGNRKSKGHLKNIAVTRHEGYQPEALSCINCAHISESQARAVEKALRDTLKHVAVAVKDFVPISNRARDIRESLLANPKLAPVSKDELKDSCDFIAWLMDNHFTFLGYEEYRIKHLKQGVVMELQKDSLMGVSRLKRDLKTKVNLKTLPSGTANLILKKQICNFAKSTNLSKVHRPAHYDYVLLKEFDSKGNVVKEHRFVGLYTSSVYYRAALEIPLVRKKVNAVLEQSGFAPNGHSIKDLLQVINVLPRDELFMISKDQLFTTALEITRIQQSQTSRLFIRKDSYGKFFSCLLYVPRDQFNTKLREDIQEFLCEELCADDIEYTTLLSESMLVRMHFIVRVKDIQKVKFNADDLEVRLIERIKPWDDDFLDALLIKYHDADAEKLHKEYSDTYSAAYKEAYSGDEGVKDISRIQQLGTHKRLGLDLDTCNSTVGAEYSFKIFSYESQLILSDVVPILENLGLQIISEKGFELKRDEQASVWIHDFSLARRHIGNDFSDELKENFEEAFRAIWEKHTDDDSFNALVVTANLPWRSIALLRAYAAYLKQIQFGYSTEFFADTLIKHKQITVLLLQCFQQAFSPIDNAANSRKLEATKKNILKKVEEVSNLSEDGALRAYLNLIDATQRTNYFQHDEVTGELKNYFSFKLLPERINGIPLPRPKYEIFVYAREMEGVHLRGGEVARGGLRWSDRIEDYRTEVLGLVKAQQVKNSVIVPVGAKGGFVVKAPSADRDEFMALGVKCYKTFISGLLDLTDNIVDGEIVPPFEVKRKDQDDPYLVVAADKGTATFSDIANSIAHDYGFWLGDGFASGGSNGYDHKAMGITAKGAWVSVQRHFRELGINVQKQDFSVVGIGDMSGDVFGNGMLLSRHICLTAAFNHLHIFIDPNPGSATSFKERQRLFRKPGSNWEDYNSELISKGGGVFSRAAKSIPVTPQMKERFAIDSDALTPDQLISALLKSPVDLIWNGGIGTYVKASSESHAQVGDKGNDVLRVNGNELRCRVVGEGGNLGFTQLARIEFGNHGGVSLTDFIDNSAGVDCSDHEVNIKILLNDLAAAGKLNHSRRNRLLESMTDMVSELVLANNYAQVQAIGVALTQTDSRHQEYVDLLRYLEAHAGLDRDIEFLPNDEQLEEREAEGKFFTRPEISVLTSYMKMYLKQELADADYLDDPYLIPYLHSAFPQTLVKRYGEEMEQHTLRPKIIATQLANLVVNKLGPSFVYRMVDSTASTVSEVIKAAIIAMHICRIDESWAAVEALDYSVETKIQADMMSRLIRLVRRTTRWLLRNRRGNLNFESEVELFAKPMVQFKKMLPKKLPSESTKLYKQKLKSLEEKGVESELAHEICSADFLYPATSLIEVSQSTGEKLSVVADIYYSLGELLKLNWLGTMINQLPVSNYWQALARETYLDDLSWQQRALTCNVVNTKSLSGSGKTKVARWNEKHADTIARATNMLILLQAENNPDYSMFSVALRELLNLSHSTAHGN